MTAKFKQIIDRMRALITFKVDKSMSDEDFIANVDAINLLINTYDDSGLDRKAIRRKMSNLFPEFSRRVNEKADVQLAMPIIKALNDFIYGRALDYGPKKWGETLVEMCCKVVDSYRREPLIPKTDYLYALGIVCRINDDCDNSDIAEYKEAVNALFDGIDNEDVAEKLRRLGAYDRAKHLFTSNKWERWAELRELLKKEDVRQLDDATFLAWCDRMDIYPRKELKKRSANSNLMQVEYIRSLVIDEHARQKRIKVKRKLARDLKKLNDDIIGDFISQKIDSSMSVSELYALETIFFLRLQLAEVSDDDRMPVYRNLCQTRYEEIAKALTAKYTSAKTVDERIEILERIQDIELFIRNDFSDFIWEEASNIDELDGLTLSQKLRLGWIEYTENGDDESTIGKLLQEVHTAFDVATLSQIKDLGTDEEREAIFTRFAEIYNRAFASNDVAELGRLLNIAAFWNINPIYRRKLNCLLSNIKDVKNFSSAEKQLNQIAAEIYAKINVLTGKYEHIEDVPA